MVQELSVNKVKKSVYSESTNTVVGEKVARETTLVEGETENFSVSRRIPPHIMSSLIGENLQFWLPPTMSTCTPAIDKNLTD